MAGKQVWVVILPVSGSFQQKEHRSPKLVYFPPGLKLTLQIRAYSCNINSG